jgi:hypothetical protein
MCFDDSLPFHGDVENPKRLCAQGGGFLFCERHTDRPPSVRLDLIHKFSLEANRTSFLVSDSI